MSNKKIYFEIIRTLIALLCSFALTFVIILVVSEEAFYSLKLFIFGPVSSFKRMGNVLEMTIPLVFTGLALSLIFQSNQFNISASGVFVMGAAATAVTAIFIPLPPVISVIVCLFVGSAVGAFFTLIPGLLKIKWNTNEIVSSLMLNYVLYQLTFYVMNYYARDPYAGAIVGLGGGVEMLGMYQRYQWQTIPSFGFDGIIVALVARNNPVLVPIAAFFLAYIRIGADIMSRSTDVPNELVLIIQSLIIVIIVAEKFLSRWNYKYLAKKTQLRFGGQ